jgi:hypothetical protein
MYHSLPQNFRHIEGPYATAKLMSIYSHAEVGISSIPLPAWGFFDPRPSAPLIMVRVRVSGYAVQTRCLCTITDNNSEYSAQVSRMLLDTPCCGGVYAVGVELLLYYASSLD